MIVYVAGPVEEVGLFATTNYEIYKKIDSFFGNLGVKVLFPEPIRTKKEGAYFEEITSRIRNSDALIVLRQYGRVHEPMEIGVAGIFGKHQLIIGDTYADDPRLLVDMPKCNWVSSQDMNGLQVAFRQFADELGISAKEEPSSLIKI